MALQTSHDIPLQITSENSSSERRITPSWTIGQLKAKLEAVTGIPPLSQNLSLRVAGGAGIPISAADEENTTLAGFPLAPYAELHVRLPVNLFSYFTNHFTTSRDILKSPEIHHKTYLCSIRKLTGPLNRSRMPAPQELAPTSLMSPVSRNMRCPLKNTQRRQTPC
jgi:tubulin-folding cofactor B